MCIRDSTETHHTVKRAAGVLGIGRNNVINIETDRQGRIVPQALRNHTIG